mgnify:CR=1 FL=1
MNQFNNEERQILNRIVKNQSIQELTKEDVLKDLKFSEDILTEDGQMQKNLLNELIQTVESMEQTEWEKLKLLFPLPTVTDEEKDIELLP